MGVTLELHAISDEGIRLLVDHPKWARPYVCNMTAPDAPPPPPPPGLLARLFGAKPPAAIPPDPLPAVLLKPDHKVADLDKAGEGIHYLLTGESTADDDGVASPEIAKWLLNGGIWVGEDDVGLGPARAFTGAETRRWSEYLTSVDPVEMRGRFSPADMTEKGVYPDIWSRDPDQDDALGYVMEYFGVLREFLQDRAKAGEGVLVFFT